MAIYYVRKNGNNSNPGTTESPRLTIASGMALLSAGDTLIVGDGTYTESVNVTVSGTFGSHTTLRAENNRQALIRGVGSYSTVRVSANYVTIDGFDITNPSTGDNSALRANSQHHINFINNTCHNASANGIATAWGEAFIIEDNICHNTSWAGWYSGISLYQQRHISDDPAPITRVCRNVCYDNITTNGSTDGNGILIDDWDHTQSYGPDPLTWLGVVYPYGAIVDNNVAFRNGNKGVGVAWCSNISVRNNTCFSNGRDGSQGSWRGDLSNQSGRDNLFANNVAVCETTFGGTTNTNTAIGNYAEGNRSCAGTVWYNNIAYDLTTPANNSVNNQGPGAVAPTAGNGNLLATNPLYVDPVNGDLRLQAGSPAINAGTAAYGLPDTDILGNARVSGAAVDIGAYEYGAAAPVNAAPVNTAVPTISGSSVVGSTLTRGAGTWTGTPTPSVTWSWRVNGVEAQANGATFDTTGLDPSDRVVLRETATNSEGSPRSDSALVLTATPVAGGRAGVLAGRATLAAGRLISF